MATACLVEKERQGPSYLLLLPSEACEIQIQFTRAISGSKKGSSIFLGGDCLFNCSGYGFVHLFWIRRCFG